MKVSSFINFYSLSTLLAFTVVVLFRFVIFTVMNSQGKVPTVDPVATRVSRFVFLKDPTEGKYAVQEQKRPVSYFHAMQLLSNTEDIEFQNELSNLIISFAQDKAVFFECIPVNIHNYEIQPFEFVLLPALSLTHRTVDPEPFAEQFTRLVSSSDPYPVISFRNLGGDALLVVPGPDLSSRSHPQQYYTHLSSFLAGATLEHRQKLWMTLGNVFHQHLTILKEKKDLRPIWLSTSGLGVSWLHVRIDNVPKYYNYLPYKRFSS